jgi:hypothetical protein
MPKAIFAGDIKCARRVHDHKMTLAAPIQALEYRGLTAYTAASTRPRCNNRAHKRSWNSRQQNLPRSSRIVAFCCSDVQDSHCRSTPEASQCYPLNPVQNGLQDCFHIFHVHYRGFAFTSLLLASNTDERSIPELNAQALNTQTQ